MRPDFLLPLLLILSLSSSLLHPAASLCAPRRSHDHILHHFLAPPPSHTSSPSPPPPPPTPISSPPPHPISSPPPPNSSPPPPPKSSPPPPNSSPPPPPPPKSSPPPPNSSPPPPPPPSPSPPPSLDLVNPLPYFNSMVAKTFSSSGTDTGIKSICAHTDNPDLCLSSIQSIAPALGPVNAASVLSLQIKACAAKTQLALSEALKIASDPKTDPTVKTCLNQCTDGYEDALDNLETAGKAMAIHDKGTMNSMLSALFSNYDQCGEGFAEIGGGASASPMTAYEAMLSKLASNCLALGELI